MHIINYNEFLRSFSVRPNGSLSLFLGAGTSAEAGIPTASALTWEFKRTLFCQFNKIKEEKYKDLGSERNQSIIQSYFDIKQEYPAKSSSHEYSFYFEKCHPNAMDRQFFIQRKVTNIKPTIGHKCLGALFEVGRLAMTWTTNFDELVENGIKSINNSFSFELLSPDNKHQIENLNQFPRVIKLHGDYRYDKLQNTSEELQKLEEELLNYFKKTNSSKGLIIIGYSGSDQSIISAIEATIASDASFPYGLYWCVRKGQTPNSRVLKAMEDLNQKEEIKLKRKLSGFVEVDGFDALLYDMYSICNLGHPEIENIARTLFEKRRPFNAPQATQSFTPVKLNAFKVKSFPTTALSFTSLVQGWKELRELTKDKNLTAALTRGKTVVFGEIEEIKTVFKDKIQSEITTIDIDQNLFSHKESFYIGLLYDLVDYSLKTVYELERIESSLHRKYYSKHIKVDAEDLKYIKFPNGINSAAISLLEAFELQLEFFNKELYFLIVPTIHFEENVGITKEQKQELINKIISNRYNQKFNIKLQKWIDHFKSKSEQVQFTIGNFKIELEPNLTYAGLVSTITSSFKGAFKLSEPMLNFHSSDKNYSTIHPLKGLKDFGPYDTSLENKNLNPPSIKIGIISPKSGLNKIANHLNGLNSSTSPKTEVEYLIDYTSFSTIYKRYLEVPSNPDNKLCALIDEKEVASLTQLQFYDYLKRSIDYFYAFRSEFDVLVLYFPITWQRFRELKNDDVYFDLHDSVKIYCAKKGIKIQFIEDKSINYLDPSKVKWWLSLGIYVKANGIPWKNKSENEATAYIGLSYAQKRLANKSDIILGSSQIFDSSGQGLRFLLQPIEHPVFIGKNPFMSKEDARRLILKLKDAYFRMDPNAKLEKLIIHKTTHFTRDEMDGIALALEGINNIELIQIQYTNWRGIRGDLSKKQPHMFPVERGTVVQLDDFSFLLWTHGSITHKDIDNGRKTYYQGKRSIPAPLLIRRFRGQDSIEQIAYDTLSLTKMNWNGGELYKTLPVTLDFSKQLSKMAKQAESLQAIPYDFRFFM